MININTCRFEQVINWHWKVISYSYYLKFQCLQIRSNIIKKTFNLTICDEMDIFFWKRMNECIRNYECEGVQWYCNQVISLNIFTILSNVIFIQGVGDHRRLQISLFYYFSGFLESRTEWLPFALLIGFLYRDWMPPKASWLIVHYYLT